jgi:hypothetical protein
MPRGSKRQGGRGRGGSARGRTRAIPARSNERRRATSTDAAATALDRNDVYFALNSDMESAYGTTNLPHHSAANGTIQRCIKRARSSCVSCLNVTTAELGLARHPFRVLVEAALLLLLLSGERVLLVFAMQHALVNRINQDFRYMLFLAICALHTGMALCVAVWRTVRGRSNWVAAWSFPKGRLALIVILRFAHLALFTVPIGGVPAQATVIFAQSALPFTMFLMLATRGASYTKRQFLGAALVATAIAINAAPLLHSTLSRASSGRGIDPDTPTPSPNLLLPVQCLGFDGDCAVDMIMYIGSGALAACTTVYFESALGSSPHPVPPEMLDSLLLPMQLLLGAVFTPVGGLVQVCLLFRCLPGKCTQ